MYNSGKDFENICEKVLKIITNNEVTVLRNQKLLGPDGLREFDIIYSFEQYGHIYTHFVECKDYNKKVDVTRIGEFVNKCNDFNKEKISRKIFITGKGFSSSALSKARREGIECWTINEFLNNSKIELTIPILVTEIVRLDAYIDGEGNLGKNATFSNSLEYISDKSTLEILEMLREKILNGEQNIIFNSSDCGLDEVYLRDIHGEKFILNNFSLRFDIIKRYYLGQLDKIPQSYLIDDKISSQKTLILNPAEILINFRNFPKYNSEESVPKIDNLLQIKAEIQHDLHFKLAPSINFITTSPN